MVPRLSISSCRVMPMPSSPSSSVRASLSGTSRIFASAGGASAALVKASNRRRSIASAALATSSRKKISRSE